MSFPMTSLAGCVRRLSILPWWMRVRTLSSPTCSGSTTRTRAAASSSTAFRAVMMRPPAAAGTGPSPTVTDEDGVVLVADEFYDEPAATVTDEDGVVRAADEFDGEMPT